MLKQKLTASLAAIALLAGVAFIPNVARAEDNNALLDILVKKKILSPKEAEGVRADLVKEQAAAVAAAPASKLAIAPWVEEMRIGGDLRLRYQYDNRDFQAAPGTAVGQRPIADLGHGSQRSRFRFRLRLDDEFKLTGGFFGGVRLETNIASDSGNQTFGDPGTGSGFSKYPIYISRAYLGWSVPDGWLTVVAGKQPNPFYTTDLVWDPDINPDGFVETFRFHKMFLDKGEAGGGYSKDGKSVAAVAPEVRPWELTLNLGEFIFADNIENGNRVLEPGEVDTDTKNDAFLFEGQIVGTYHFSKNLSATFAPGFMFYNAASVTNANNENSFSSTSTTTLPHGGTSFLGETRDLAIITAPGDVTAKIGPVPVKTYWDFAYNTAGNKRVNDIYGLHQTLPPAAPGEGPRNIGDHRTRDDFAWLLGLQLGQNKKAGDLSVFVNYRETGIGAVDPNLNDSDFALGELNTRGIKTGITFNLTDFATVAATYYNANNLRKDLVGGFATGGPSNGVADANSVQVFQFDVNVKF